MSFENKTVSSLVHGFKILVRILLPPLLVFISKAGDVKILSVNAHFWERKRYF